MPSILDLIYVIALAAKPTGVKWQLLGINWSYLQTSPPIAMIPMDWQSRRSFQQLVDLRVQREQSLAEDKIKTSMKPEPSLS